MNSTLSNKPLTASSDQRRNNLSIKPANDMISKLRSKLDARNSVS